MLDKRPQNFEAARPGGWRRVPRLPLEPKPTSLRKIGVDPPLHGQQLAHATLPGHGIATAASR